MLSGIEDCDVFGARSTKIGEILIGLSERVARRAGIPISGASAMDTRHKTIPTKIVSIDELHLQIDPA